MAFALPADCDARIRHFADYLASKAPSGRLPGRQDIVPHEIPDLLPYLMLYDIVPQPSGNAVRYRIRLAGTYVVELLGGDPTGKFVDDVLLANGYMEIIGEYDRIVTTKQSVYLASELRNPGREHVRFQRLAFPLAGNGEDVNMLVLIMVGFDVRRARSNSEATAPHEIGQ